MSWWQATKGSVDESRIGITFVDVLFALVIGEILGPLRTYWTIPQAGWSHLAVALTLTLGSWVGYHSSANRPQYMISFFNWPTFQFLLDIGMVMTYWIAATSVETKGAITYSALPESICV